MVAKCSLLAFSLAACDRGQRGDAESRAAVNAAAAATVLPASQRSDSAPQGSDSLAAIADRSRIQGSPNAPVWMIVVSDFQCPYCRTWHDSTYETLRREYVESGKIRLAYIHLPLSIHRHAMVTAEASMCAGVQGKFWQMHDGIFATQDRWTPLDNVTQVLDSLAAAVGLNVGAYKACMASHALRPLVIADRDRSVSAGVQSTPTFLIGQERVSGAEHVAEFRRVLDRAIAAAGPGSKPR